MGVHFILTLLLTLSATVWAAGESNDLHQNVKGLLHTIETVNKSQIPCNDGKQCSYVLKGLISVDKKDEFFGLLKNQYETCARYIEKDKNSQIFKTPYDLSLNLAQYQAKNSVAADSYVIDRCLSEDVVRSKEAVSKYYYYVSRMQAGQVSDIEEIAEIDRVLNVGPVLGDVNCSSIPFGANQARCNDLKKNCKGGPGLDDVVQDAANDLKQIKDVEKEIDQFKMSLYAQSAGPRDAAKMKEIAAMFKAKKFQIDLIKSRSPVLNGEVFQDEKNKNLKEAVRHQLQENKKRLNTHLVETNQKHVCMTGTVVTRSCSSEKVREFVEKETPRLPQSFNVLNGKNRNEAIAGSDYMTFQTCLHDAKVDQLKADEVISGAVLNTAIGLATVGLGSAFSAARAVQTARQMQIAEAAKGAMSVVNVATFGVAIADAGIACLVKGPELKGDTKAANSACQINSSFSSRVAVKEYDECVMKLAFAGLAGVPLAIGAVQKAVQTAKLSKTDQILLKSGVSREELMAEKAAIKSGKITESRKNIVTANAALDDASRVQKIAKDFKNLTKDQIDCVVTQVHTIGKGKGVYNYSAADINLKAKTLRRVCQIGFQDMKALLQLGYAGELPPNMGASDFAQLLERTMASQTTKAVVIVEKSIDDMQSEMATLTQELSKATDPLKRVQLRDQMSALEKQMIDEQLRQNPKILDDILAATEKAPRAQLTSATRIGNENALKLSPEKSAQLDKAGVSAFEQMMIETKPGDTIYFKSFSFGNGAAKVKGADPSQPGNVFVEILNTDPKKARTVSMSQLDIAMTDKEKAEAFRLMMEANTKEGSKILDEILKNGRTPELSAKEWANQVAKQVGRSSAKQEADDLLITMQKVESRNGYKNHLQTMTDPEYVVASKRYQQLTMVTPEESQTIRALREIDVTRIKPTAEELKVLNDAKKIRSMKSDEDLTPELRSQFKYIDTVEKQMAAAPEKYISSRVIELQKINGSPSYGRRYDYPSQSSFQKSFAPKSTSLSMYEKQDYQTMEKLFTENPQILSDESRKWLRGQGAVFYSKHAKPDAVPDAGQDYFLKRLKLYLDIERNK
jgi:hypothetical protein